MTDGAALTTLWVDIAPRGLNELLGELSPLNDMLKLADTLGKQFGRNVSGAFRDASKGAQDLGKDVEKSVDTIDAKMQKARKAIGALGAGAGLLDPSAFKLIRAGIVDVQGDVEVLRDLIGSLDGSSADMVAALSKFKLLEEELGEVRNTMKALTTDSLPLLKSDVSETAGRMGELKTVMEGLPLGDERWKVVRQSIADVETEIRVATSRLKDMGNEGGLAAVKLGIEITGLKKQLAEMKAASKTMTSGSTSLIGGDLDRSAKKLAELKDVASKLKFLDFAGKGAVHAGLAQIDVDLRLAKSRLAELGDTGGVASVKLRQQIAGLDGQLKTVRGSMSPLRAGFDGVRNSIEKMSTAAKVGFATLTGGVLGFAAAGLRGTAEGEALSVRVQMLSREIAAVFLPAIQSVTRWIGQLVQWFRELTGSQQDSILMWTAMAAAALGAAVVLPKVFVGTMLVAKGILAMTTQAGLFNIATAGIPILIGAIVTGAAAAAGVLGVLAIKTEVGRKALSDLMGAVKPLAIAMKDGFARVLEAVTPLVQKLVAGLVPVLENIVRGLIPLLEVGFESVVIMLETFNSAIDLHVQLVRTMITPWVELINKAKEYADVAKLLVPQLALADVAGRKLGGMMRDRIQGRKQEGVAGGGPAKDHRSLSSATTGFEGIAETYNRIQMAALKHDTGDAQQQTADNTKEIANQAVEQNGLLREFTEWMKGRPSFVGA